MNREPVLTIGAITALVVAFVALLSEFGVPIRDGQQAALVGFVGAAAPVVAALIARRRVAPVEHQSDSVMPSERGAVSLGDAVVVACLVVLLIVVLVAFVPGR